jgi:hypothetical protein
MKLQTYCLLIIPFLTGCSLLGAGIGKAVDRSFIGDDDDRHKYESEYMVEGLQEDVVIIQEMLTRPEKSSTYIDPDPCKGINSIQVCTLSEGCWCETRVNE